MDVLQSMERLQGIPINRSVKAKANAVLTGYPIYS